MGGEAMPKLRELFEQALSLPHEEREAFAMKAFPDDSASRARLLNMLRACEHMDGFLKKPALFTNDFEQDVALPERIGAFEIEAVLGSGGMGVVYQAKQHEPSRRVAIKVLAGIPGIETIKRFRREATFLAQLRHPNIAQVYEAGSHDDGLGGRPYFVMELVEDALPLDEFAQRNNLSIEDRLRMFIKVCHAVQFGHQRGVIHRDLKPSNILVGSDGEPKVIDFGVAHATSDADMSMVSVTTSPGHLMGTLRYMSPEQFGTREDGAGVVDTRTDVYSLGVVLYELMCGESPYDLSSVSALDMPAIIRDQEVPRLSRHNPSFKGDLETIVHKALEKLPERRYETVHELAEDVQRYLNGEPIAAKRDRAFYVLRKSLMRYRAAVLVIVGFLILSTASAIAFAVLYDRAESARAETEVRNEELRQENYFALISLADDAIHRNSVQEARNLLERCPEDLRAWEWRFLWNSIDDSSFKLTPADGFLPTDMSPDRKTVVAIDRGSQAQVGLIDVASGGLIWHESFGDFLADPARFSADGKYFAAPFRNQTAIIYETRTQRKVLTLRGNVRVLFTPDSTRVVAHFANGVNQVWDIASASLILEFRGPSAGYGGAISPDSRLFASGTHAGVHGASLVVYDLATGTQLWRNVGEHHDHIRGATFTSDGSLLFAAGADRVTCWDVREGTLKYTLLNTQYKGGEIALSPDDQTLVMSCEGGIMLYDAQSGTQLRTLRGHETEGMLRFLTPSTLLSAGRASMHLWDLERSTATMTVTGHPQWLDELRFAHNGRWLATKGEEGELHLRDAQSYETLHHAADRLRRYSEVRFSPDDRILAHASVGGDVELFEVPSLQRLRTLPLPGVRWWNGNGSDMWWHPDGRSLFASAGRHVLRLDAETGVVLARVESQVEGWHGSFRSLTVSADGALLATGDDSGRVTVYRIDDLDGNPAAVEPVMLWQAHDAHSSHALYSVNCLLFTSDSNLLISGGNDRTVRVWSMATGEPLHVLHSHASKIHEVGLLQGENRIVSTSGDHVCLWDVQTGRLVLKLRSGGHRLSVHPHTEAIVVSDTQNIRNMRIFTPEPRESAIEYGATSKFVRTE